MVVRAGTRWGSDSRSNIWRLPRRAWLGPTAPRFVARLRVLKRLRKMDALRPVPPTSVGPGSVFIFSGSVRGEDVKTYKTYVEQVGVLAGRGMDVGDSEVAVETLRRVNYYRLSGYWYPFRKQTPSGREDDFYSGTRFSDVVALYEFDVHLRAATFAALAPVELAIRALLGHELGRIDPCPHLDSSKLGPIAQRGDKYSKWLRRYEDELKQSREDFVDHHRQKYGGRLPVRAATELMDWGSLTYLYGFSSRGVQVVPLNVV